MKTGVNGVALGVFIFFFLAVTVIGFMASRWRKAENEESLDEWGLGGRSFGTWVTWFLLGGDLYTAYTFVAVPALIYAAGAAGFFAVPYTILVYPLIFTFLPRLWSVSHKHGYVTTSDFVRGRFGSKGLSLAVAVTGILATMPYIALQLVGIQAVLDVMGVGGESSNWFVKDLPLLIAFAVLAAYTYSSGLRAPALIAFVKDGLIYLVIIVAIIYIPIKLGGFDDIFAAAGEKFAKLNPATGKPIGALAPGEAGQWGYATLALGSALALFMYPHSITATLSSRSRNVIRRNTTILPLYSLMLGLLALLGFMAIAAGVSVKNPQLAIPQLFENMFPDWFAGVAFAAIGIGALVPAAIMSIAAANLFTRNIYRDFIRPDATPAHEAKVSKLVSLLVKVGALAFVLTMDKTVAINFQLLGGIWILQTMPALVGGLFTRWFHRWALLAGWAAGMLYGTFAAFGVASPTQKHFGGSSKEIPGFGEIGYIGLTAFVLNAVVVVVLTFVLKALKAPEGVDETSPADYTADAGDKGVQIDLPPATAGATH
ncbi:monocarboxylate uptake permease MctP [Streptomyces beijiangensis]|uniref:Sodium:solute symporter family protein n=1 Tax=Streptomyces beijiangensis TaxID=163361 RepID=A0A939F3Y6_9ACTN|nr:sodium:solute symporter family protein [Streptomyces beijiangensis]MBO0511253.1 sodium:solute symporter family protein [Streptomyces beijiangensis]